MICKASKVNIKVRNSKVKFKVNQKVKRSKSRGKQVKTLEVVITETRMDESNANLMRAARPGANRGRCA